MGRNHEGDVSFRGFPHPTINGEPYFDKPLLRHWFIAIVSAITGRLDEWTVRLPSAISGLLALWATTYLGRKLWSREVGRVAGWILLTTYGFLFWGRTAAADMENLAAITLAVAWYWKRRERPNFCSYIVFYLICSLGAQTKGLTAIVVPIVAVLPDFLRERRWKMHFSFSHLMALAPFLLRHLKPDLLVKLPGIGHKLAPLVATAAILMGGFFCWQQVILDTNGTERPFARGLKTHLAGLSPTDIAFYRHVSPEALFHLNLPEPIRVLKDPCLGAELFRIRQGSQSPDLEPWGPHGFVS